MAYKTRPGETQHQARERIARAKGFASYRAYRKAPAKRREEATTQLARRDPGYARTSRSSRGTIRTRAGRRVSTPGGLVLTTTDMRRLYAELRDLAPGRAVNVWACVKNDRLVAAGHRRKRGDRRRFTVGDQGFRQVTLQTSAGDLLRGQAPPAEGPVVDTAGDLRELYNDEEESELAEPYPELDAELADELSGPELLELNLLADFAAYMQLLYPGTTIDDLAIEQLSLTIP